LFAILLVHNDIFDVFRLVLSFIALKRETWLRLLA